MSGRQIIHVDMDAFYASVEQLDDPSLVGKELIIGGPSRRGVVCTASYEARRYGVKSAMPMSRAMQLCPHAIVVAPRMTRYADLSGEIMSILERYTPLVEPLSLDEAFLDVTASRALFGDGEAIARAIRSAIKGELGLTASAGVAASKFVAKIASDLDKPDGLTIIASGEEARALFPLPIERMWGIGPKSAKKLRAAGFDLIGDLARSAPHELTRLLGNEWGAVVVDLANGRDARDVIAERAAVSIGSEETFEDDLTRREDIERALLRQSERVASRLVAAEKRARTVQLKVKYADFTLVTRRRTLAAPIADTTSIHRAACGLLDRVELEGKRVRLTGVSASQLQIVGMKQKSLFEPPAIGPIDSDEERRHTLEKVALEAATKFGHTMLVHADTLQRRRDR